MTARIGPGRPRSEITREVLAAIQAHGPITARELALKLQIPSNVAWFTCSRLQAAGEIEVADYVRQVGANRPSGRYVVATPAARGIAPAILAGGLWGGK